MKFRSKFRRHGFIIRPTRRVFDPVHNLPTIVPGLNVKFSTERVFDSVEAQQQRGWTDEERNLVEDYLLKCKQYGVSIWVSPGQDIPEEKLAIMRVKPKNSRRPCVAVALVDGEVVQCANEATPGRDHCKDHDPEESRIVRAGVEQRGL